MCVLLLFQQTPFSSNQNMNSNFEAAFSFFICMTINPRCTDLKCFVQGNKHPNNHSSELSI